jgi:exoribonuclease-2
VGVRARRRVRLRRAGARLLRRQGRRDAGSGGAARLFAAPHYFRRLGKGRFRKAPEEIVKAALLGIERKRQVALQVDAWAAELVAGTCPAPIREQLYRILFKPDKNAPEYKAVVEASRRSGRAPLDLLKAAGAIDSPYEFHWRRFLFEEFPKGVGFGDAPVPSVGEKLALSPAAAFSIDDSATTEIDDALSVQGLGTGRSRSASTSPRRRSRSSRARRWRRSRATASRRSTSPATS